jgi:PmbA protein
MEKILELAMKKAPAAEVIRVDSQSTPVEFKAGKLSLVSTRHTTGWGLRVIVDGHIGFSSTTNISQRQNLVENALLSANFGQEATFEFPTSSPATVPTVDSQLVSLPMEEMIEQGQRAVVGIAEKRPEVFSELMLSKLVFNLRIINSAGLDIAFQKTNLAMEITGLIVRDGLLWVTESWHGGKLAWQTDRMVADLLQKLDLAKRTCSLPTTRLPVLFAAQALPNLLMGVEMGVNGKNVQKGSSPLCGRLDEQLMDRRITIVDDATLPYGVASYPFDGEGVPSRRTVLIEKGVLRGYLYDLQTAGLMKTASTGHGDRGFDSLPSPTASNLLVEKGDKTLEQMVAEISQGLIVYSVLGGGQSNLLAGDFSLNADLAYKIDGGEIIGRVKDTMISGNIYEACREITAIGQDQRQVDNYMLPAIAFTGLDVSSTV